MANWLIGQSHRTRFPANFLLQFFGAWWAQRPDDLSGEELKQQIDIMSFLSVKTCLILKQTINIYQHLSTVSHIQNLHFQVTSRFFGCRSRPGPISNLLRGGIFMSSSQEVFRMDFGWLNYVELQMEEDTKKDGKTITDDGFQQFLCPVCVECTLFLWGGLLHWVELHSFEEPFLQPRSGRMLPKSCLMSIPILIILDKSVLYQLTR